MSWSGRCIVSRRTVRQGSIRRARPTGDRRGFPGRTHENDIVLVFVDGKLQELHKTLQGDCSLVFETTGDEIGHSTYKRSMCLMLVKAIYDAAHHEGIRKVRVHYSMGDGYYCTMDADFSLTPLLPGPGGREDAHHGGGRYAGAQKDHTYRRRSGPVPQARHARQGAAF